MARNAAVGGASVALAFIVGCGGNEPEQRDGADEPPMPPVVSSMSPTSGPYGAEIVIEGEGFTDVAKLLDFVATDGNIRQFDSHEWTDQRIRARIPFPLTGRGDIAFCSFTGAAMRESPCTLPGQSRTTVGSFTVESDWQPGYGLLFRGGVLAARVLSNGSVAAVSTGDEIDEVPHLAVFGDDQFTPQPITGLPDRPRRVVVIESADGRAEVVTTSAGGVVHHRWNGDTLESIEVGVTGLVVAGGSDDAGRFVWVSAVGTLTRLRVDEDWAVDRTVPWGAGTAAIAADGTLVIARIESVGDLLDERYRLNVASLAPDADTVQSLGEASLQSYDAFPWVDIEVSRSGQVVLVSFCAEDGGQVNCNYRRVRDASGEWSNAPELPLEAVLTVGENALAVAYRDSRGVVVRRDFDQPDELVIPVWPASPVALLIEADALRPLVRHHFDVFAPRVLP